MKIPKKAILIIGLALLTFLSASRLLSVESQPTGYDLVAAVNAYRAANGYYQLSPNSLVASAAQSHAEWIVETGQGGHTGSGGSDETVRVSWTGYGGGATIQCDECWATASSVSDAVYSSWSDSVHQEVMLNAWGNLYTDAGGGVAAWGNGTYVFIYDVCMVVGQGYSGSTSSSTSGDTSTTAATADYSNYIYGVTVATPQADGTITHTVLYGQTLATIAEAYGITVETLQELNGMAADDTVIWTDQELIIQQGTGEAAAQEPSAIPEGSEEAEPGEEVANAPTTSPTRTSQPTWTMSAASPSPTPQETQNNWQPNRILGMILLVGSGAGLAVYLYFSYKNR